MTYTPPYSLRGESGKTLDSSWHTLEKLGIHAAALTLRSLAEDELVFTQRWVEGRIIPDDEQWISLADGDGTVVFTGIAKRTYQYPQNIYQFSVTNVYRGLTQTPLTDAATGRPYTLYEEADLSGTLVSILARAADIGLPIQPPASMPATFVVPKMAFVSASCGSALEDALKWLPDAATYMDYSSAPPTLGFARRVDASPVLLALDTSGHGVVAMSITSMPEARALSVAFVYGKRNGDLEVSYATQSAGDDSAEAHRSLSIYLSGHDRSDMLVSEALVTAHNSLATSRSALIATNQAVTTLNASLAASYAASLAEADRAAASAYAASQASYASRLAAASATNAATRAAIPADTVAGTAYAIAHDTALSAGTAGGVAWQTGGARVYYNGYGPGMSPSYTREAYLSYAMAYDPTVHVWPVGVCAPGTYSDAQLAIAGATKAAGLITGEMFFLQTAADYGYGIFLSGFQNSFFNSTGALTGNPYLIYRGATLAGTAVDFLSMTNTAINAALRADADATLAALAPATATPPSAVVPLPIYALVPTTLDSTFVASAVFVEAPYNLAYNYFTAQNWLPYSGQLSFTPTAPLLPAPGDFVSISGDGLPAAYATMATPVAALQIDLNTGAASVTLGPSARMTYASLQDRLRIPPTDNYTPA